MRKTLHQVVLQLSSNVTTVASFSVYSGGCGTQQQKRTARSGGKGANDFPFPIPEDIPPEGIPFPNFDDNIPIPSSHFPSATKPTRVPLPSPPPPPPQSPSRVTSQFKAASSHLQRLPPPPPPPSSGGYEQHHHAPQYPTRAAGLTQDYGAKQFNHDSGRDTYHHRRNDHHNYHGQHHGEQPPPTAHLGSNRALPPPPPPPPPPAADYEGGCGPGQAGECHGQEHELAIAIDSVISDEHRTVCVDPLESSLSVSVKPVDLEAPEVVGQWGMPLPLVMRLPILAYALRFVVTARKDHQGGDGNHNDTSCSTYRVRILPEKQEEKDDGDDDKGMTWLKHRFKSRGREFATPFRRADCRDFLCVVRFGRYQFTRAVPTGTVGCPSPLPFSMLDGRGQQLQVSLQFDADPLAACTTRLAISKKDRKQYEASLKHRESAWSRALDDVNENNNENITPRTARSSVGHIEAINASIRQHNKHMAVRLTRCGRRITATSWRVLPVSEATTTNFQEDREEDPFDGWGFKVKVSKALPTLDPRHFIFSSTCNRMTYVENCAHLGRVLASLASKWSSTPSLRFESDRCAFSFKEGGGGCKGNADASSLVQNSAHDVALLPSLANGNLFGNAFVGTCDGRAAIEAVFPPNSDVNTNPNRFGGSVREREGSAFSVWWANFSILENLIRLEQMHKASQQEEEIAVEGNEEEERRRSVPLTLADVPRLFFKSRNHAINAHRHEKLSRDKKDRKSVAKIDNFTNHSPSSPQWALFPVDHDPHSLAEIPTHARHLFAPPQLTAQVLVNPYVVSCEESVVVEDESEASSAAGDETQETAEKSDSCGNTTNDEHENTEAFELLLRSLPDIYVGVQWRWQPSANAKYFLAGNLQQYAANNNNLFIMDNNYSANQNSDPASAVSTTDKVNVEKQRGAIVHPTVAAEGLHANVLDFSFTFQKDRMRRIASFVVDTFASSSSSSSSTPSPASSKSNEAEMNGYLEQRSAGNAANGGTESEGGGGQRHKQQQQRALVDAAEAFIFECDKFGASKQGRQAMSEQLNEFARKGQSLLQPVPFRAVRANDLTPELVTPLPPAFETLLTTPVAKTNTITDVSADDGIGPSPPLLLSIPSATSSRLLPIGGERGVLGNDMLLTADSSIHNSATPSSTSTSTPLQSTAGNDTNASGTTSERGSSTTVRSIDRIAAASLYAPVENCEDERREESNETESNVSRKTLLVDGALSSPSVLPLPFVGEFSSVFEDDVFHSSMPRMQRPSFTKPSGRPLHPFPAVNPDDPRLWTVKISTHQQQKHNLREQQQSSGDGGSAAWSSIIQTQLKCMPPPPPPPPAASSSPSLSTESFILASPASVGDALKDRIISACERIVAHPLIETRFLHFLLKACRAFTPPNAAAPDDNGTAPPDTSSASIVRTSLATPHGSRRRYRCVHSIGGAANARMTTLEMRIHNHHDDATCDDTARDDGESVTSPADDNAHEGDDWCTSAADKPSSSTNSARCVVKSVSWELTSPLQYDVATTSSTIPPQPLFSFSNPITNVITDVTHTDDQQAFASLLCYAPFIAPLGRAQPFSDVSLSEAIERFTNCSNTTVTTEAGGSQQHAPQSRRAGGGPNSAAGKEERQLNILRNIFKKPNCKAELRALLQSDAEIRAVYLKHQDPITGRMRLFPERKKSSSDKAAHDSSVTRNSHSSSSSSAFFLAPSLSQDNTVLGLRCARTGRLYVPQRLENKNFFWFLAIAATQRHGIELRGVLDAAPSPPSASVSPYPPLSLSSSFWISLQQLQEILDEEKTREAQLRGRWDSSWMAPRIFDEGFTLAGAAKALQYLSAVVISANHNHGEKDGDTDCGIRRPPNPETSLENETKQCKKPHRSALDEKEYNLLISPRLASFKDEEEASDDSKSTPGNDTSSSLPAEVSLKKTVDSALCVIQHDFLERAGINPPTTCSSDPPPTRRREEETEREGQGRRRNRCVLPEHLRPRHDSGAEETQSRLWRLTGTFVVYKQKYAYLQVWAPHGYRPKEWCLF